MEDENYRAEFRNHLLGHMSKNPNYQSAAQQYREIAMQNQQKLKEYDAAYQRRHPHVTQYLNSSQQQQQEEEQQQQHQQQQEQSSAEPQTAGQPQTQTQSQKPQSLHSLQLQSQQSQLSQPQQSPRPVAHQSLQPQTSHHSVIQHQPSQNTLPTTQHQPSQHTLPPLQHQPSPHTLQTVPHPQAQHTVSPLHSRHSPQVPPLSHYPQQSQRSSYTTQRQIPSTRLNHSHHNHLRSVGGDADNYRYTSATTQKKPITETAIEGACVGGGGGGDGISDTYSHSYRTSLYSTRNTDGCSRYGGSHVCGSNKKDKHLIDLNLAPNDSAPSYRTQNEGLSYLYANDGSGSSDSCPSEISAKTHKSSKTVVSRRSSRELRKIVTSQCKLHKVIDETINQMCANNPPYTAEITTDTHGADRDRRTKHTRLHTLGSGQCKHHSHQTQETKNESVFSQQRQTVPDVSKTDCLDCRTGDTLTISVDDVVNSKVINPMLRKLQRMYLNNLKEEMSLMEDLERLPHKVSEVYKATIFKQKD